MNIRYINLPPLFRALCLGLVLGAAALAPAAHAESSIASPADYAAIRQVVGLYLQAGREAKSETMKPAFHKDAIMYSVDKGSISGGPIQNLYDYIDGHPKADSLEAEITAIDIASTVASVRVESDKWHGARFSDIFLLLKDKEGWKIITKVYHTH